MYASVLLGQLLICILTYHINYIYFHLISWTKGFQTSFYIMSPSAELNRHCIVIQHSSLGDGRVKIALQCRREVYTAYSVLLRFHQSSNVPLADSSFKTLYSYIQLSCQKSHSFYPCFTVWPQTQPLSKVLKVCQAVMHYPWCWRLPLHDNVTY